MGQLAQEVHLRTGHAAWVRPIRGTDATELQRAFALLSDLSRYQRFMTGTPHLTDRQATYFSAIDHSHHEALVALPEEHGLDIVGVARFIRYPAAPDDAELAVTIADEWHDRGLATVLLHMLSARARMVGVRRFRVDLLADNVAVLALLRSAGLMGEVVIDNVTSGYVELGATE